MSDSVTYAVGYKRSLPNYENVTPFFSITRDVREGETFEQVKNMLVEKVEGWLETKIAEIDQDAAK